MSGGVLVEPLGWLVGDLRSLDGGRVEFFVDPRAGEVRISLADEGQGARTLRLSGSDADVFATLLHVAERRLSKGRGE